LSSQQVLDGIPHRDPFLFVDDILECNEESIIVEKKITGFENFFQGHYPNNPIMPGVLLCECVFQAGALWISKVKLADGSIGDKVPVVTRVNNVKFKRPVMPDTLLKITSSFEQQVSEAYYMKGYIEVNQKRVMSLDFTCTLIDPPQ
jgi:3-hydroxyacyl-[acyl-carrier-protein] dehydratase